MTREYRKFKIEMEYMTDEYRLWQKGFDDSLCILESYKDKRSVYFEVSNLLPSSDLHTSGRKAYHFLLLGVENGEVIYKDFGEFHIERNGSGSFFKKFKGADIECYTHCLLIVLNEENGVTQTILSGQTPFAMEEQENPWKTLISQIDTGEKVEIFAESIDETNALWHRFYQKGDLPACLMPYSELICKYGNYIIGRNEDRYFIGIPGRFLQAEQPKRNDGYFTLWQPISGGEAFFSSLEELTGRIQEQIFGYWIGEIDVEEGKVLAL